MPPLSRANNLDQVQAAISCRLMPTDATDAVYTKTCLPVPQNFYVQGQLGKRSLHTPSTPSAVSPALHGAGPFGPTG